MYDLSILNNKVNYEYFLQYYQNYNSDDFSFDIKYSYYNALNDKGLKLISDKYNPFKIVNGLDDFYSALKLMEWTFNHLLHSKEEKYTGKQFAIDIIEFSDSCNTTVNCLCHATVLTEMLLCLGYKVKKVYTLSCDVLPSENHVVVDVFIKSLSKWVMLDPTLCCYITNEENIPLSVSEIRNALMKKTKFSICYYNRFKNKFNGNIQTEFKEEDYIAYLYKNFFRFLVCSSQHSCYVENNDDYYMLVPNEYLTCGTEIYNYTGCSCVAKVTTNSKKFWS